MADIKELDGKIMAMAVNPDLGCCAKAMWSWCAHCKSNSYICAVHVAPECESSIMRALTLAARARSYTGGTTMTMKQKQVDDTHVKATDVTICGGAVAFSPLPCCLCCGYGPLKPEFRFVQDANDKSKWVADGSVFPYMPLCACLCEHAGDNFVFDDEHNATDGKPVEMIAGRNMMNPYPFWGMKLGNMKVAASRGGAPQSTEMSR